jgi:hypothetical protein
MLLQAGEESVPEAADRADVRRTYDIVLAAAGRIGVVDTTHVSRGAHP